MSIKLFIVEPTDPDSTNVDRQWRNPATGEIKPSPSDFGPGAMWADDWFGEPSYWIRLPNNGEHKYPVLWNTCQAPRDGVRWTVTGTAPNITVEPSINAIGAWHGWIRNGEFTDA